MLTQKRALSPAVVILSLCGLATLSPTVAKAQSVSTADLTTMVERLPLNPYAAVVRNRHHADPSPDGQYFVTHAHRPRLDAWGQEVLGPDGTAVATPQLYISDRNRLNERVLFESDDMHAQEPRWSPDGNWIAFMAGTGYGVGEHSLYLIRPDGSDLHIVATSDTGLIKGPSWSADSQRLAFTVRDPRPTTQGHVHIINVDGTGEKVLNGTMDGISDQVRWSPRGDRILVSWANMWSGNDIEAGMYVVDPDGTNSITWIIEPGPGMERFSSWAGDDAIIFKRAEVSGPSDLLLRELATGEEWFITDTPDRVEYFPTVSRDGTTLFYDEILVDEDGRGLISRIVIRPMAQVREQRSIGLPSAPRRIGMVELLLALSLIIGSTLLMRFGIMKKTSAGEH